ELEKRGFSAQAALRRALTADVSLEVRQRIEQLLRKLPDWLDQPEHVRILRALEVVERIGAAHAQAYLRDLSRGEPEARLTQEAGAALQRLEHKRPLER